MHDDYSLAKMTFAPGERGEILARFNVGVRCGLVVKTIRVSIAGEPEPT